MRLPGFQKNEDGKSLEAVVPPVHKVPHEDIICVWHLAPGLKQLHQVMELAVNVAAYCDGAVYRLDVGLFYKNLFYLLT